MWQPRWGLQLWSDDSRRWMYIGPQGIVHGTFNTLLNAGRLKLGIPQDKDLRGHLFVSSGLGGMSGAQPKAAVIAGAACIVAEVDRSRIETRHSQGWVQLVTDNEAELFAWLRMLAVPKSLFRLLIMGIL